eukprot:142617_1
MHAEWNTKMNKASCIVTTIIAAISFIGVSYVFISILLMRVFKYIHNKNQAKQSNKIKQSNVILHTHIFYVSICGILNYGLLVINFAPFAIANEYFKYPETICKIIGFIIQIAPFCEAMWYCVISITIHRILHYKWTIAQLNRSIKYHHLAVWSTGLILAIIPTFSHAYGQSSVESYQLDDIQALNAQETTVTLCWIKDEDDIYFLLFYIPLLVLLMIDIYCLYNSYKFIKERSLSTVLLQKCFLFVLIYVIIWIPPMILRFIQVADKGWNAPFWFLLLHHVNICLPGIITAIIWGSTESFVPFYVSLRALCRCCSDRKGSKHRTALLDCNVNVSPPCTDKDCVPFQNVYKVKPFGDNNGCNEDEANCENEKRISLSELMPPNEMLFIDHHAKNGRKITKTNSTLRMYLDDDDLESTETN